MQSGDLYNAYGTKLSGNPSGDPFGFCAQAGAYTDSETGLSLMGLRYYDPSVGRFLTRDPSGYDGGPNLYDYTGNNPVNYADPMGLSPWGDDVNNFIANAGDYNGVDYFGAANNAVSGFANTIDGGLSMKIDQALGTAGTVDQCSDSFKVGGDVGQAYNLVAMCVGDEEGAAAESTDAAEGLEDAGAIDGEGEPNPCGCCLIGSTPVWMSDGTTKPIEDLQVGEQVISRDPATGQDSVQTVTTTYCLHEDTLITLSLEDPSTHVDSVIVCTPDHAMYIQGQGWIEAGDLTAGEQIVTRTGAPLTITNLQWQRDETGKHPFTVYNLEVANDHTYFAGNFDGGLWVHNACRARPSEVTIPNGNANGGWNHIEARHITGTDPGGDLFAPGTTRAQLSDAANDLVSGGQRVSDDPSLPVQTFQDRMSINGVRGQYRAVVHMPSGTIISMFPFTDTF